MLKITGVNFEKCGSRKEIQERIRQAMIQCFECKKEEACETWIETASKGTLPPDFCQLRALISQLRTAS